MNVCTACVSMRGLIYRSQGCLVSLTSAVNTVILNLHPAKGSKLRNNYARPRLEGVARTTRRRGVHGMNILLSISVSSVLHPPLEGDNTLEEKFSSKRFNACARIDQIERKCKLC